MPTAFFAPAEVILISENTEIILNSTQTGNVCRAYSHNSSTYMYSYIVDN